MKELSDIELNNIKGGFSLTASMLDGISKLFTTVFSIGESLGSALHRAIKKNYC